MFIFIKISTMATANHQTSEVGKFAFLTLIERFVYYGFRSIMVLYFVSADGLQWESGEALAFYSNLALAFALATLPMGFLADKLLGYKRALRLGFLLMAVGYFIFFLDAQLIVPAMVLTVVGSGLFRPTAVASLGQLFSARSAGRDIAFLALWLAINIGAGLASLAVGFVAEEFGFHYGFGFVAGAAAFGYLISQFFALQQNEHSVLPYSAGIRAGSVLLVLFGSIVFWGFYEIAMDLIYKTAAFQWDVMLFGEALSANNFIALTSSLSIPALILTGAIWYSFKFKSTFLKIAIGFALGAAAYFLFDFYNLLRPQGEYISKIVQITGLLALAEVMIAPMAYSVLTKNAARNWSATVIGLFYAATFAANRYFNYLIELGDEITELSFLGIIILIIAALFAGWYYLSRYALNTSDDLD